jgi:hypothetical protein
MWPWQISEISEERGGFKCQVDLGIEILNYAIRKEWTDLNEPPPQWMRQTGWLPCECGRCFCCLNGLTNWIGHRKKWTRTIFIQHDNTRTMTDNCTTKRVDLDRGCEHCKICLRKINANPTEEQMTMNGEQRERKHSRHLGWAMPFVWRAYLQKLLGQGVWSAR